MGTRLELNALLKTILGSDSVYFQPPASIKMTYPCIVYQRDYVKTVFANNSPYLHKNRYKITVIDKDPDSLIPAKIGDLMLCTFDRRYTSDNLNHDVYTLYF